MKIKKQHITPVTASAFALVYLISFLLYYLSVYVFSSAPLNFIYAYFTEICEVIVSPLAAVLIYGAYKDKSLCAAVLVGVLYSSLTVIQSFPAAMFDYAYSGYLTQDVIILSALNSVLAFLYAFIAYIFLFALIILAMRIVKKRGGFDENVAGGAFDFSAPDAITVFVCCAAVFVYKLVFEIIDTVKFFISYSETFTAPEVLFIVFRYTFILLLLLLSQITVFFIKRLITNVRESE